MQHRSLQELINTEDPAWPLVQEWIATAHHTVEVLPTEREKGEETLLHLQITTRSPMGAIVLETGGILIDHGWLRFLGAGNERMQETLLTWNTSGAVLEDRDREHGTFLIAYDILGGFFALNGGAFPGQPGNIYYFAPDSLKWEDMNMSYSQILNWALNGDLEQFYQGMRWPDWEQDCASLSGDFGISIYPFLFTNKEMPIATRSRRPMPMAELWRLHRDLAQHLKDLPAGTTIQFNIDENA